MSNDSSAQKSATKIINSASPVAALFTLNERLIKKSLAEFPEDHIHSRPNDNTNSCHWIFGHITTARYEVANFLGSNLERSYGKLFSMSSELKSPSDYPPLSELLQSFEEACAATNESFAAITEDEFNAPTKNAFPSQDNTVRGCVTFLNFHETYHVGQMALVQRFFGCDRLVG